MTLVPRWLFAACLIAPLAAQLPPAPPVMAPGEVLPLSGGRSLALGKPVENRQDFQATAVADGRVLLTGGAATASTEWFDPTTRLFSRGPALTQVRAGHRALKLRDGRILLLGGTEPARPAEVSDGAGTRFQPLSSDALFGLSAEAMETGDGQVLMVDGATGRSWVWDGQKAPRPVGPLQLPRVMFRLTRLSDGRILATGGLPVRGSSALSAEVFQSSTGKWTTLRAPLQVRARHQALALADGRVLLFGGHGLDPKVPVKDMEWLTPGKDTVETRPMHPGWGPVPAVLPLPEGRLLLQADRGRGIQIIGATGLPYTLASEPRPSAHLTNAYQEASLAPLPQNQVLVLGTALAGAPVERWDPKYRHVQPFGVMRPGAERLVVLPDKRILAVGPIVDQLDLKTATWKPLGWREDLAALLKKAKGADLPGKAFALWPKGQERAGALVLPLDKARALVLGGAPGTAAEASPYVGLWEPTRKSLKPAGTLGTPRRFTASGEGALKLPDGSVLVYGGAEVPQ